MFIHTLTFLNISKSSPSKTYLACVIPNLCFIIQSSRTHFSLKMQDVTSPPVLHSLSRLPLSPYMWLYPAHHPSIIYVFVRTLLCFLTFVLWNIKYYFLFQQLSLQSPLRFCLIEQSLPLQPDASGYLLISALIVPLCVHPNLTSQLYIYRWH